MKFLLPISLFANLLLAGFAGYLLGTRPPASPIESRSPAVATSADGSLPAPRHSADIRSDATIVADVPAPAPGEEFPGIPGTGSGIPSAVTLASGAVNVAPIPTATRTVDTAPPVGGASSRGSFHGGAVASRETGTNAFVDPTTGETVQIHNPATPGNSVAFQGIRVGLTETYDSPGAEERGLGVELEPDAAVVDGTNSDIPVDGGETVAVVPNRGGSGTGRFGSDGGNTVGRPPRGLPVQEDAIDDGLTYDDELFRMKWGWAAFDAARTEAKREADRRRHGG